MKLLNLLHHRDHTLPAAIKAATPPTADTAPDSPPPRRRRIHRRRPSGAAPQQLPTPSPAAPTQTPPEITASVLYAQTMAAYLVGQALSLPQSATSAEPSTTDEAPSHARAALLADFTVFESDQVQWAGYLMQGAGDAAREGRVFVKEAGEVLRAVEWVKGEVGRACGGWILLETE